MVLLKSGRSCIMCINEWRIMSSYLFSCCIVNGVCWLCECGNGWVFSRRGLVLFYWSEFLCLGRIYYYRNDYRYWYCDFLIINCIRVWFV